MRSWIARRMLRATNKRNSATDLGSRFADAVGSPVRIATSFAPDGMRSTASEHH
jgi:hypothetical protein